LRGLFTFKQQQLDFPSRITLNHYAEHRLTEQARSIHDAIYSRMPSGDSIAHGCGRLGNTIQIPAPAQAIIPRQVPYRAFAWQPGVSRRALRRPMPGEIVAMLAIGSAMALGGAAPPIR
jgi:hypothetical protein